MRKLIDKLLNKPEPEEPEVVDMAEKDRVAALTKISDRVEDVSGGQSFHIKKGGASLEEVKDIIGNVPWAALTDKGQYVVAMPGPVAMATLVMTINHHPSLCQEINSLMVSCSRLRSFAPKDSTFNVLVDEIDKLYTLSGHASSGMGTFGFREEPSDIGSMVYGLLEQRQVAELGITISGMSKTRPDFQSEGLNQLFDATIQYWADLMDQVGPTAVMQTLGDTYEGKA